MAKTKYPTTVYVDLEKECDVHWAATDDPADLVIHSEARLFGRYAFVDEVRIANVTQVGPVPKPRKARRRGK